MNNINYNIVNSIKNIKRKDRIDNRPTNFIRADRNEKVDNWEKKILDQIHKSITPREFTAYLNPTVLKKILHKYAKYTEINPKNICIYNGGDPVIREFIIFNFKKNLKVGVNHYNYQMYDVYFNLLKIKPYKVGYNFSKNFYNLFQFNKKNFFKILPKIDIFFFTFPNQISNEDFTVDEFNKILKKNKNKIFFIDESYYGFGHNSFIKLIKKNKNLFILRSITKTFGLAPHRVGFLIANKDSIKKYRNFQTPYPLSIFSVKLLSFFTDNFNLIIKYQKEVIDSRELIVKKLRKRGYFINNPKSNFINVLINNQKEKNYFLKKAKIMKYIFKVNNFSNKIFIRITFGKLKTMKRILNIFDGKNRTQNS